MSIELYSNNELQQVQALPASLYIDFLEWIDRPEATTRSYIINLRQFIAWMHYRGISAPTRADLMAYRDWLSRDHEAIQLDPAAAAGWSYRLDANGQPKRIICKPSTVNQYLRSAKRFFKWAENEGYYQDIGLNVHGLKESRERHKRDVLEIGDVLTIENSIKAEAANKTASASVADKDTAGRIQRSDEQGKRLLAMYLLATQCGLRTIELHRANVGDLETKPGSAWLRVHGKGHTESDTRVPLAAEVAAALRDYLDSRSDNPTSDSPLFVSTGNRSKGQRIATTTISTMLKKAMQAAGYNSARLTAHSLRHTAGTAALDVTGDNLYKVQHYLRHKNPQTTEIYLHKKHDETNAEIAQAIYNYTHNSAN